MKKKKKNKTIRVGVDTGGTFTDFVFEAADGLRVFKVPSTPDDPARAISEGLLRIVEQTGVSLESIEVVHGTTVGTNALLQRRGARVALITTAGFEDVIEIGRQARPELYNLNAVKPPPLVSADLRFGVSERVAASGEVLEQLDGKALEALIKKVRGSRCDSVAISLLFSFVDPSHEKRIEQALRSSGLPLSSSHRILPEYREYERTSTVAVNAYLQPLMGRYLGRLTGYAGVPPASDYRHAGAPPASDNRYAVLSPASDNRYAVLSPASDNRYAGVPPASGKKSARDARVPNLRVMQSSGGSISAGIAATEPVRTILSGPAGGVVGATHTARAADLDQIITFDMGGTSTDVALCDRDGIRLTNEAIVAGLPVAVPMMDIHTVGAGGGSIARVDEGGSLRVGPESAGADPGPACYGKSFLPTVTDAHVVLGHFPRAALLDGEFKLDEKRARASLDTLAKDMSKAARRKVSAIEAARGVLEVVNTNMERALRHISVERGHDPREFTLVPFGGAGGLHAVALARALRIPRILLPSSPGALSAIGVVTADVVKDQSRTVMYEAVEGVDRKLERVFREMEQSARAALRREGFDESKQRHERSLAARYKGQSFELQIKQASGSVTKAFHRAHLARYGYAQEKNVVEIVSARVRSIGLVEKFSSRRNPARTPSFAKPHDFIKTYFDRQQTRAAVYDRARLGPGSRLRVPCIVTEYSATTLIPNGARASVDSYGNVIIQV